MRRGTSSRSGRRGAATRRAQGRSQPATRPSFRHHLGDEEGRRVQVPQFLEELEDLVPGALERCEGVQGVEAVQRDEVAAHFLLVPRELSAQAQEPSGLLADFFDFASQRAHVDDVDAFRVSCIHAERGHLRDERGPALLHRKVQPGGAVFLRLVEEDAVHERRLQRARRSGDEDDVTPRDSAAQTIVQANDIRRNLVCRLRQDGTPSRPVGGTGQRPPADKTLSREVYGDHTGFASGAGATPQWKEAVPRSHRTIKRESMFRRRFGCPRRLWSEPSLGTKARGRSSTTLPTARTSLCGSRAARTQGTRSKWATSYTRSISCHPGSCESAR